MSKEMGSLSTSVFKKANSFESVRLLNRRSTPEEQTRRALCVLTNREDNEDAVIREVINAIIDDLEFELSPCDENLKGSREGFKISDLVAEEMDGIDDSDLGRYLYHRYRYEIYPKRFILDDAPPCVQIEPSSICNYRCSFCFQTNEEFSGKGSTHMGRMELKDFKNVVDSIRHKVEIVTLASRGEPTLNKDFATMIEYASEYFLSLKVNTNASLLTERICEALLGGSQKTIVLSIDSGHKETYEEMRVNGKYDRIKEKLRLLKSVRERKGASKSIIRVSGVYMSDKQSMEEMELAWGEFADQITFVKYNPWEDPYGSAVNDVTNPCSDLWRRLFIWHDLRVNPCDTDYMSMLSPGSLRDFHTLEECWKSDGLKDLRELHCMNERNKAEPCSRCTVV